MSLAKLTQSISGECHRAFMTFMLIIKEKKQQQKKNKYTIRIYLNLINQPILYSNHAGIEMKFKNMKYPVLINPSHVPELSHVETTAAGIWFGGAVTLTRVDEELKDALEKYPGDQSTIFVADLHTHLTSLQLL